MIAPVPLINLSTIQLLFRLTVLIQNIFDNQNMEDEITKHTKKIYDTAKSSKHSFGEKVKEIIIEICIIVFAVTLSIWFHGWSDHRHEQKEAKEFLKGLKDDLIKDIKLLEKNKKIAVNSDSNFNFLASLKNNQRANTYKDSEINNHLSIAIPVTLPSVGRYEGFKSSGKIGTIENDSLKGNILIFYQQTLPELAYSESFINSWELKILDQVLDKTDKTPIRDFLTTTKMQSLYGIGAHNLEISI